MKIKTVWIPAAVLLGFCSSAAWADTDSDKLAQGAVVGASTEVVSNAALNTVAPEQPNEGPFKRMLRRMMTGAATGAAAAKLTDGEKAGAEDASKKISDTSAASNAAVSAEAAASSDKHKHKHKGWKHSHEGERITNRPPGWDRGKKTGWGDGDVPPGLAKKESKNK